MTTENPFEQIKDLINTLLGPIQTNVSGLMDVVYGKRSERSDLGLQGEVAKNTEFRLDTIKFRKWLITISIIFAISTIGNLIIIILTLVGKLPGK